MKKLWAVIKREYIQRVRTKFFVVATILGPIMMAGFTVVPGMMMMMRTGGPTRIAVIDQTGDTYAPLANALEDRGDRPKQSACASTPREHRTRLYRLRAHEYTR